MKDYLTHWKNVCGKVLSEEVEYKMLWTHLELCKSTQACSRPRRAVAIEKGLEQLFFMCHDPFGEGVNHNMKNCTERVASLGRLRTAG